MNVITRIEVNSNSRMNNGQHYSYHKFIFDRINKETDKTVFNIPDDLLESYGDCIDKEQELNRESRIQLETEDREEEDIVRDNYLTYLFSVLDSSDKSPVPAVQKGGKVLKKATLPYRGIQREPYAEETGLVQGLLRDLRKDEYAEHVTALNLGPVLDALEEVNNKFVGLEEAKILAKSAASEKENMKTVRLRTDDYYLLICDLIYASGLLCTEEEKLPAIKTMIRDINAAIATYRTLRKQSASARKEKEEGTEKPKPSENDRPVIPDDDKEPEEKPEEPDEGEGEETDRPVIPDETEEGKEEPEKDENGDDLPEIE